MKTIEDLIKELTEFRDARDWKQFHNSKASYNEQVKQGLVYFAINEKGRRRVIHLRLHSLEKAQVITN